MKPVIYTDPDEPRLAHLVDEHSATVRIEKTTGRHLRHFDAAIAIQDLEPGKFRPIFPLSSDFLQDFDISPKPATAPLVGLWRLRLASPWVCVFATINQHQLEEFKRAYADTDGPEVCHGLHKRAAEVLLMLSASFNNVKPDQVTQSFSFGEARIENTAPSLPWDEWAFVCAWLWSDWEKRSRRKKLTLANRFEEIQAVGYPNGVKAFEAMHRRLFPKPTH